MSEISFQFTDLHVKMGLENPRDKKGMPCQVERSRTLGRSGVAAQSSSAVPREDNGQSSCHPMPSRLISLPPHRSWKLHESFLSKLSHSLTRRRSQQKIRTEEARSATQQSININEILHGASFSVSIQTSFTVSGGTDGRPAGRRGRGGEEGIIRFGTDRERRRPRERGRKRRPSDDLQGGTAKTFPFLLLPDKNFCRRPRNDINKIMMS